MEEFKYHYKYPHPSVTTDCAIFGFDGISIKVLLIQRGLEPYKDAWALPGGFLRMDETADECAKRELEEETGLKDIPVEQFHTLMQSGFHMMKYRVLPLTMTESFARLFLP